MEDSKVVYALEFHVVYTRTVHRVVYRRQHCMFSKLRISDLYAKNKHDLKSKLHSSMSCKVDKTMDKLFMKFRQVLLAKNENAKHI